MYAVFFPTGLQHGVRSVGSIFLVSIGMVRYIVVFGLFWGRDILGHIRVCCDIFGRLWYFGVCCNMLGVCCFLLGYSGVYFCMLGYV